MRSTSSNHLYKSLVLDKGRKKKGKDKTGLPLQITEKERAFITVIQAAHVAAVNCLLLNVLQ